MNELLTPYPRKRLCTSLCHYLYNLQSNLKTLYNHIQVYMFHFLPITSTADKPQWFLPANDALIIRELRDHIGNRCSALDLFYHDKINFFL